MRNQTLTLTSVLTLSLTFTFSAQAQLSEPDLRALAKTYTISIMGEFVRDWCIASAPQTKTVVNNGFAGWQQDTKLDVIEQKLTSLSSSVVKDMKASMEPGRQQMYTELDKAAKNAAQECQGIRAYLNQNLHPQMFVPTEYAAALKVQVKPTQTTQAKPAAPTGTASSSTTKTQEAAAKAEADRFKWVTAPGQGVQLNQIQTILYHGESVYGTSGLQYEDKWVLLLKDGWAYNGLRVSPHDLDVKASRQNEPNQWFKWKLQGGKYYAVDPKTSKMNPLEGTPVTPAKTGERLNGTFTFYSFASYGGFGGYSSQDHISFKSDGSFERFGSFIGGTGVMQSLNGSSSAGSSTYSKDGCVAASTVSSSGTSTTQADVGGGSVSKRDCGANNLGTYALNGYTLELRYMNGTTSRQLFFFDDGSKKDVLIGSNLYQGKK